MSTDQNQNLNPDNIKTVDFSKHAKLKVKPNPGFAHAKNRNLVAVNLSELGISASNFPHVFVQNPDDGEFLLVALLGLRPDENIQYGEQFWDSTYVPLAIQRHPFVVGRDDRLTDIEQITTCLETDSPFLNEKDGLALFTEDGKETDYLRSRHQLLNSMFEGGKLTRQFTKRLVELDLLSTLELAVQLQNGEWRTVKGFFTLDEAKLNNLSAEQLKELQNQGFLGPCYLILTSLYQLNQLIRLRNRKGKEQIVNFRIDFKAAATAAE